MTILDQRLDNLFITSLDNKIFSGAAVGISFTLPGSENRVNRVKVYGRISYEKNADPIRENTFFDIASLTKPLATTLAVLSLIKEKKISWRDPLEKLLSGYVPADKKKITLEQLLSHSAGLSAYKAYFKRLKLKSTLEHRSTLQSWILGDPLEYEPGTRCCYSDLGFILLGLIVEETTDISLQEYFTHTLAEPLGIEDELFYLPIRQNKAKKRQFAATENCPWRGHVLQGEVHDEHAWCMGGVAGHAGLFGTVNGVLTATENILDLWQGKKNHPYLTKDDIRRALTQKYTHSTWACGFDTPSKRGSTSGRYFSPVSVGHLGYTGTSFWIDPLKDVVVVLLTNRVHPTRENTKIRELRPLFHDTVMECLREMREKEEKNRLKASRV